MHLPFGKLSLGISVNGAQIMIDQYISAAEDKWKLQNGLGDVPSARL
jgi:2-oxoglutarate dehydrogenase E1 component